MGRLIDADAAIAAVEWGITRATLINIETGEKTHPFDAINEELQKAVERIKKLPTVEPNGEWISVKDRLPPEDLDVLIWFKRSAAVGAFINGDWCVNSGDEWVTGVNEDEVQPTYWMPLQEPPKMERSENND